MDPKERRRHVRMKPLPELPASAALSMGVISEKLQVLDVSIGGMALLVSEPIKNAKVGDRLALRISLARYGEHAVVAVVRYVTTTTAGIEFADLTPEATSAARKYVAELLERGAMS
jgi:hypothetical protein